MIREFSAKLKVYSFDIFDTLIARETATPAGIFSVVQYRLRENYASQFPVQLIEEFYFIRIEAENKARAESGYEECTFESIYYEIQQRYQLSQDQTDLLKQIEIKCELDCVIGIPQNIARVHDLLDRGCHVILTSDTYLSNDTIRLLLYGADARIATCPLYVSSEKKVAKHTGNLFRLVLLEENISGNELFHCGDNRVSDYIVPQRLGINAEFFNSPSISEYEKDYFVEDRLYIQLLAGVSKNFRLLRPEAQPIERIGACLGGPLLYGYIDAVLRDAFREGIKRIYFLARDGQILLKIAQTISDEKKCDLDLRYLYVSRQVCYLASLFEITQREIYWLKDFMFTFKDLAIRLDEDPQKLYLLLPKSLQDRMGGLDQRLSAVLMQELGEYLMSDNVLNRKIRHRCEALRKLLYDYLKQEGFFENEVVWLVDIGWSGRMQDSLYKSISFYEPTNKIIYHYFGMSGNGRARHTHYTNMYNDKKAYIDLQMELRTHVPFMEVLTSADHGTTMSYVQNSTGKVDPVLDAFEDSNNWNLIGYQQAVLFFTKRFCAISAKFPLVFNYHRDIVPLILKQASYPSLEVADCLGEIPYTLGHSNKSMQRLAAPLSIVAILAWATNRERELASWMGGALKRSPWHVRYTYRLLCLLREKLRIFKIKIRLLKQYILREIRLNYKNFQKL